MKALAKGMRVLMDIEGGGAVAVEGGLSWLAAVGDLDPWLAVGQ